jgi:hypothetical protein
MKELLNINIENITVNLTTEHTNVRVKFDHEETLLLNQDIDTVTKDIRNNFSIVKNHFQKLAYKAGKLIDITDINKLSLLIVLYYLFLYSSWKVMYPKQKNRNLNFDPTDFNNPSTYDIIFHYFKSKSPEDWKMKSAILLDFELDDFDIYYKRREDFYNK